jgi:parallel beta-helix repeat protein
MRRNLWGLLLLPLVLGLAQPVWSDDLYVVMGGGRAVGTAIGPTTTLPYGITQPGFYYLSGNLNYSGNGDAAITIGVDGVTLDLMGFSINTSGTADGISTWKNNVEVRNGSVVNCQTGINAQGNNLRFANLKISNCTDTGIYLNGNYGNIVTNCQISNNASGLIVNGGTVMVDKNIFHHNTNTGFVTYQHATITNNIASWNGTGFELAGQAYQLVDRNNSYSNTTNWKGLTGCTVGLNGP